MKNVTIKSIVATSLLGCALMTQLPAPEAVAQAMSPMRGQVKSFTDSFALKVYPANPYNHRIRVEVKVYDKNFYEIKDAKILPANFTLAGQAGRQVTVIVPFANQQSRKVRVCTESIPFPGQGKATASIKAQVCGKFLGERHR